MSPLEPLEILQVIGYSIGALLPLWMLFQLVTHRDKLSNIERLLALLALTMGGWHTSNLVITLHALFDLGPDTWTTLLRFADTVAVVSITFAYSFLLHVHLHLWANAQGRGLNKTANLGSLLPSVLLAYYIYRYRYLEIIIEESLVVVPFATVVLTVYVFGIRTIGDWATQRYGVRPGLVEALLILALALLAAPLRGWLAQRFHKLFEREAALYKEIVARIGAYAGQYKDLADLLHFVEERTTDALGLRQLKIFIEPEPWVQEVLDHSKQHEWQPVEDEAVLVEQGFRLAYPLRREDKVEGLLAVDAASASLTPDARSIIGLLADQVAIAIDDSRLFEENLRLERELAERERLAALGRMAATVAHEIKNPLSAIKSIAQVMREDESLRNEYERDLGLIVGETDRLSQSVTQLLNFARKESLAGQPLSVDELVRSVVDLFRANAS